MPLAKLEVTLPEGTWIRDVSSAHPDVTFRVLAATADEGTGFALVEILTDEMESVVRSMIDHDQLTDIEPIQHGDDRVVVQIETAAPLLVLSAQASGLPIELPVVIKDGVANLEIRASGGRLSEFGEQLEAFGHSFEVKAVRDEADPNQLLSERQRQLLLAAVEKGYYETPRDCSLTELAEERGIAKSTCSETLRRAEQPIIQRFVNQHLSPTV